MEGYLALLMHPVDHLVVQIEAIVSLVQPHLRFGESIIIPEKGERGAQFCSPGDSTPI